MKENTEKSVEDRKNNWKLIVVGLVLALIFTIFLSSGIGPVWIPLPDVGGIILDRIPLLSRLVSGPFSEVSETIVMNLRLPRIIIGVLVGAALGVAGAAVQGIFRNPMAEPYTVGVSSGAALGAIVVIFFGMTIAGTYTLPIVSFLFALGTILTVYRIAKVDGKIPVGILLLSGIAISLFLQAIVSTFMYMAGEELQRMVFWIMGGLWGRNWTHVQMILPPILLGTLGIFSFSKDLDAMLLGEESAQHLGVRVERTKKYLLILASVVTAAAVAVSGVIGFVGLIIPHIMRILVGPRHRILFPASAFGGAIFLVWADNLARVLPTVGELPVGIITALAGGPFFIYLLKKKKYSY